MALNSVLLEQLSVVEVVLVAYPHYGAHLVFLKLLYQLSAHQSRPSNTLDVTTQALWLFAFYIEVLDARRP